MELAESFIPILGKLYRRQNVVVTLFGASMNNIAPLEIIRLHQECTDHLGQRITVEQTALVLRVLSNMTPLSPIRVDLGLLFRNAYSV